jgi:ethanolamine utilization protein EutA
VYGLLRHATAPSGSTLYLPRPDRLPLRNVPIVGKIGPHSSDDELGRAVDLAAHGSVASGLRVDLTDEDPEAVRQLGGRLAQAIELRKFPRDRTLVVLVTANIGKALGNYITRWGTLDLDLIVVDEVPSRDAQFVRLGRVCEGAVPISLYGMQ